MSRKTTNQKRGSPSRAIGKVSSDNYEVPTIHIHSLLAITSPTPFYPAVTRPPGWRQPCPTKPDPWSRSLLIDLIYLKGGRAPTGMKRGRQRDEPVLKQPYRRSPKASKARARPVYQTRLIHTQIVGNPTTSHAHSSDPPPRVVQVGRARQDKAQVVTMIVAQSDMVR